MVRFGLCLQKIYLYGMVWRGNVRCCRVVSGVVMFGVVWRGLVIFMNKLSLWKGPVGFGKVRSGWAR